MNNFLVYIKKEFLQMSRSGRYMGIATLFAVFAVFSPALARYGEHILHFLVGEITQGGLLSFLAQTEWRLGYVYFYQATAFLGVLVCKLVFCGIISHEKADSTIYLAIIRGFRGVPFALMKFASILLAVLPIFFIAKIVVFLHIFAQFQSSGNFIDIILSALIFSAYIILICAIIIFASAITKSSTLSAVCSISIWGLLLFASSLPAFAGHLPPTLIYSSIALATGESIATYSLLWPLLLCGIFSAILVVGGGLILETKN